MIIHEEMKTLCDLEGDIYGDICLCNIVSLLEAKKTSDHSFGENKTLQWRALLFVQTNTFSVIFSRKIFSFSLFDFSYDAVKLY